MPKIPKKGSKKEKLLAPDSLFSPLCLLAVLLEFFSLDY